jgi:hypothetical protein
MSWPRTVFLSCMLICLFSCIMVFLVCCELVLIALEHDLYQTGQNTEWAGYVHPGYNVRYKYVHVMRVIHETWWPRLLSRSFVTIYVCVLQLEERYRETALSEADATFMTVQSHFRFILVFCLFQVIVRLSSPSTVCITATKSHSWNNK